MILPRGRRSSRRYQRHKVIAIVATFAIGWVVLRFVPVGTRFQRVMELPQPTPRQAFDDRSSGVTVRADVVVERVLSDSLPPGRSRALRRWRVRSADGHPFTLVQEPDQGTRAGAGDTVAVVGVYLWDTSGGVVVAAPPPDPSRP